MQTRYEELKSLYQQTNCATNEKNQQPVTDVTDLSSDMDAYLNKIRALESKIELGKKIIQKNERNQERLDLENKQLKDQVSSFEKKVKSKKDKIKGLTSEYGDKSKECEAFRQRVSDLEKQLYMAEKQSQDISEQTQLIEQLKQEIQMY